MNQREQMQQTEPKTTRELFRKFAQRTSQIVGSHWMFLMALLVVLVWGAFGPLFRYSDTWQLVINTGTTIVTFLIVFLIQNTQNRDSRAIHLKLDELIRAMKGARNKLVSLEDMTDDELDKLQEEFQRVCGARKSRKQQAQETREQAEQQKQSAQESQPAHA